ncbi:D-2-hydroxyacid dehydrogenase [Bacillus sp. B1-b2]|uniref:D-2-hydroxyacid dehydrogenase n=1 Tax=Bacillus sp. B1-b2 TaxID=2653201 RepID=UPI001261AEB5|nr:D-2-hydroxyacid dehydrogenase [Bacillus sp. B1-b2]KAB7669384.1 D-2-hydroxyacid dehydrogenase [Bacillus sp. B1-b2]
MSRKLLLTHSIDHTLLEKLKTSLLDWDIIAATTKEEWTNHLVDAEIILGWRGKFDRESVSKNKNLQWIQTWSAGVNTLPLEQLSEQNVTITSANGVHSNPISETIFALMLGLTRNIHGYVRNQTKKEWDNRDLTLEIHNKTIGIIGVGAIGKETAKIAKAFGMHVIGVRNSGKPEHYVDSMYTSEQLDEILPECDYVVVTLPLTDATYHMFQAKQFKQMKNSSFFINIGRGGLVKEDDLIDALETGEILGAGLDVFEKEPLPQTNKLWDLENVIVTPHTSGSTEHYDSRVIEDIFLPNLASYLNKEPLVKNVVDYQKGY